MLVLVLELTMTCRAAVLPKAGQLDALVSEIGPPPTHCCSSRASVVVVGEEAVMSAIRTGLV